MIASARNRVRIIGGRWRRRLLAFPDAEGLRPTADAVREKLFNWLGQDLDGWRCLDLFAGSGALGFEAASRGAAQVVMVESNPRVCRALCDSLNALGADNIIIECANGVELLQKSHPLLTAAKFDLVMLDPPFSSGLYSELLAETSVLLNPGAFVYVEHDGRFQPPANWEIWREGRAGRAHFCLLKAG
ncbi:MAG TPA: 16S rRNA (guanine(966)-N(2))-methyltransferase RsmD [Burkholderiales bacterium]|nr:16S rRNA (guanine(966)-N(2))-methyltransferase RsmD [Burkholderiales bacterium]